MNNTVDYDKMFKDNDTPDTGSNVPPKSAKELEWEERYKKDLAERNMHSEKLERFRNGPKHYEGYFERADGFADMRYPDKPSVFNGYAYDRYLSLRQLDLFLEYIDGFLGAVLFGVIVWCVFPSFIPVTIAAAVGFVAGILLKFRVRDRMSGKMALKRILPLSIILAVIVLLIIVAFKFPDQ
ncbi:MAG: hypothetical protein IJ723_02250 [Ruminococcus sp.]|nr:hypothetical protein [Ruminococcus sp.]